MLQPIRNYCWKAIGVNFGESKSDDSKVRDQSILLRLSWYVDGYVV
jgi:hypothetical protein